MATNQDFINIDDKVKIVSYRTIAFNPVLATPSLTEFEWQVLTGMFVMSINAALAECINPNAIAEHGDAVLAKNYRNVVALAEKLGVIQTY